MAEPMDAGSGHEGPQTPFPARSSGARDLFWGSRGRSPSSASLWPRRVGWLEHLIVLQASPADTREAVPETNDGAVQGHGDDACDPTARPSPCTTGKRLPDASVNGQGRSRASGPRHRGSQGSRSSTVSVSGPIRRTSGRVPCTGDRHDSRLETVLSSAL